MAATQPYLSRRDLIPHTTAIAACIHPKYTRKLITLLTKSPYITRLDTGFDFYADPTPSDTIRSAKGDEAGSTAGGLNTLCRVKIMISPHPDGGDSEWRYATLGGLLQVEGAH